MGRAFVVDASALIDALVFGAGATELDDAAALHAPTLLDYEFASAARRLARESPEAARLVDGAMASYPDLQIERHPAGPLMPRMWSFRDNLSMYDASYVALAQALGIPLVTTDRRLARAAAPHCDVVTPT